MQILHRIAVVAAGIALVLPVSSATAVDNAAAPADEPGDWIQLFNGKDLTGWTPKITGFEVGDNHAKTFRVKDGVLSASYADYKGTFKHRFGHLFYKEPFSNYILRLEYRLVGEQMPGGPEWGYGNSGIMIHGQTPESMGREQFFPVSIEVQLLEGGGRPTGNVCTPGTTIVLDDKLLTSHCANSKSKTYPIGEWVAAEVEVHGDKLIRHKINGETVLEYRRTELDEKDPDAKKLLEAGASKNLTGGTISLQSESHPIEFRKIELKKLPE